MPQRHEADSLHCLSVAWSVPVPIVIGEINARYGRFTADDPSQSPITPFKSDQGMSAIRLGQGL